MTIEEAQRVYRIALIEVLEGNVAILGTEAQIYES